MLYFLHLGGTVDVLLSVVALAVCWVDVAGVVAASEGKWRFVFLLR